MNFSRKDIESIIARNKKQKSSSKSPSPPMHPKTLIGNRSVSPKDMTNRYQQLCVKYKQLLEEVKDKNHKFELQQSEMQRLKAQKQRDQKQIFRLRSVIGLIKKQDKGFQVNMDMQSGGSWSTKIQKSTTIDYQQELDWSPIVKNSQSTKLLRRVSPQSRELEQSFQNTNGFKTTTNLFGKSYDNNIMRFRTESINSPKTSQTNQDMISKRKQSKQVESKLHKLSNSPYSKLRFSRKIDYN